MAVADRAAVLGEKPIRMLLPPVKVRASRSAPKSTSRRSPAASGSETDLGEAGRIRFEALRAYRLETARRAGVPPYVVAADRTLRDVALLRPRSEDELLLCHGIGPAKARKYGAALLAAVGDIAPSK